MPLTLDDKRAIADAWNAGEISALYANSGWGGCGPNMDKG